MICDKVKSYILYFLDKKSYLMGNNGKTYNEIKAIVRRYFSDSKIMLFGSRAREEERADSDYDKLIITEESFSSENKIALRTKIRKELLKEGYRADVLLQNKSEVEKKRRLPGHIIRNILKDAVML